MAPEPKEIGHQVRFPNTMVGLFRKGCWFIPEIMASTGLAMVGFGLAVAGLYKYSLNDGDNKEFKMQILVLRPDDPRAKLLKNPTKTEWNNC